MLDAALRILAVAVLLIWAVFGVGLLAHNNRDDRGARDSQSAQYEREAEPSATRLSREVCANAAERSTDPAEQRAKDDLCAQFLAAQAAHEAADAAASQTIIGAAGLIFILATLIANALATFAAVNANKQAREQFAEERRAWLHASFATFRVWRDPGTGAMRAHGSCTITNSGGSAATNISVEYFRLTPDWGPREDSELQAAMALDRNRPLMAGEMLAPQDKPLEKSRIFWEIPDECYIRDPFRIGAFNVAGWVRYRFKGASRYHVTPFVRWTSFSERADDTTQIEATNHSQGTNVEPD